MAPAVWMNESSPRRRARIETDDGVRCRQQCLSWTVEWIDEAGRRSLVTAFDTLTVREAYERVSSQESQRQRKRRKVDVTKVVPTEKALDGETDEPLSPESPERAPNAAPDVHFYLLRPRTTGPDRVLIPVSPTTKLSDALRDRVVLEFPTFYIFPHPPDSLSAGFISEAQFLGGSVPEAAEEVAVSKDSSISSPEDGLQSEDDPGKIKDAASVPGTDVQHILRMLARDAGSS